MAYRLKSGKSVSQEIRRIVIEEIDSAVQQLRIRNTGKRDEAIHEARKSIKKIRGVLKLIRPEIGSTYETENEALRNLAAKLSELRDAGAMIETLNSLTEKFSPKLQKRTLGSIHKGLLESKREKERALQVAKAMRDAAGGLLALRKRVPRWPLNADGFKAIAPGLKESYRRGRKAMVLAGRESEPELFHEWRKRAKDHWYHVRLLENLWTEVMEGREKSLHDLESWLGDDHNLIVLQQQLKENPDRFSNQEENALFQALARELQEELRNNSFWAGRRLYEEKPKRFLAGLERLWAVSLTEKENNSSAA